MTKLLVVYATAHGSTRDIAERIADRLKAPDHQVDVLRFSEVDGLRDYDAVVLGSAIHRQAWLPEAIGFVRAHAEALRSKPSWLFSVGVPAAFAPKLRRWAAKEGPKVTEPVCTRIRPRGEHLFSGVLRAEDLPGLGRLAFRVMGGRFGDFRDEADIDRWADDIARQVRDEELGRGHA